ncbi:rhodanese-like domain-containing protein [uncultured Meiothermus sp.]|jgi:rhodanese-related sulfurtransferase|uniref:rhodanese-like domain-containing protein n=1 Tax=uncultured Meiothermus sp. TaxID=157471 RepID=UPI002615B7A6|nr:rhodanese-like domain-containing protein [uncultured Meiothermus sp.]
MRTLKPELLKNFSQDNPLVVDVRPPEQYNQGDFAGALHLTLADIQHGNHNLPKDRPLLLICERGVMSELAGLYLEAAGYELVYNLEGGLQKLRQITDRQ